MNNGHLPTYIVPDDWGRDEDQVRPPTAAERLASGEQMSPMVRLRLEAQAANDRSVQMATGTIVEKEKG